MNLGFFSLRVLAKIINRLKDAGQEPTVEVALRDLEVLEGRVCLLPLPTEAARQLHGPTYLLKMSQTEKSLTSVKIY